MSDEVTREMVEEFCQFIERNAPVGFNSHHGAEVLAAMKAAWARGQEVCEWRFGETCYTSCGSALVDACAGWGYCPYCGRKIKEVGSE